MCGRRARFPEPKRGPILPTVLINGFDLYYEEGGEGQPVVFVHGGFASLASSLLELPRDGSDWSWEHDLAEHFRFVEYDRRGCFRSSRPEGGFGLLNHALDLECLLDFLDVPAAHLIGSSAGGPIAVIFAATRPDRTRSMVLAGTGINLFDVDDLIDNVILEQIRIFERKGAKAAFQRRPPGVEVSLEVMWAPEEHKERGTIREFWTEQHRLHGLASQLPELERVAWYAAELTNIKDYVDVDVSAYAKKVRAPTLVVHGANDRIVPPDLGEELAQVIPGAKFELIPGASHTLVHRDAEMRKKAIAFIQKHRGRPRVSAAVFRANGSEILMVKHRRQDGTSYWQLPGGGVLPNERLEDAVKRELLEETGLCGRVTRKLFTIPYKHGMSTTFLLEVDAAAEPKLGYDPEEAVAQRRKLVGLAWMPVTELRDNPEVKHLLNAT